VSQFQSGLMSHHAIDKAKRERIPITMIALTYDEPDARRESSHDAYREVRTRWFGEQGVCVVVDHDDGRIVTVWRTGWKP
jgi:hypothetical protein